MVNTRIAKPGDAIPAGVDITVAESAEREIHRSLVIAAGILLLMAIGLASYFGVKRALLEVRAAGVAALRDAEVRGLEVWLEQRIASAERWANQPQVREIAGRMLAQGSLTGARPSSCDSPDAQTMQAALQPGLYDRGFVTYDLIDRSGTILASGFPEYCGLRTQAATFFALIEEGFSGNTVFVPPILEKDRLINAPLSRFGGPLVWIAVPVRSADGAVIAVLTLGEPAATRFTTLLSPPGLGDTDEAYAFDRRALMLTESRHQESLVKASLLMDPRRGSSTLNVELRDPGGNLLAGYRPAEEVSTWRTTRLVLFALAAAAKSGGSEKQGVILEPYRNYRGIEVIGAWRWLDQYGMAVALEMESDEAFAPLRMLDRGFAIALALAIATAIGALMMVVVAWRRGQGFRALRRIGRYTLIRSIGEGGMAQVYLGRHALLKRPIAIKILKRQATDELIKRFEREAQLASQLAHPNTVEIFDYGHTRGGEFYYVMEYVDGITLSALVARDGPLPVGRIVYFVRQICSALHRAHQQGLIHRDIKPDNIMVCVRGGEYDVIKILDFGLVKSIAEDVTRDLTHSIQHVLGTPVYMSPERFADPRSADIRADIYAIGAVAYLLATGKRLFDGSAGEELQFQIMHSDPAKPSAIRGSAIPAELETIILGCLAKNPGDRPQSVQSLIEGLRSIALDYPWSHREAEEWWIDHAKQPDGEVHFTRAGARPV
jgi:eukaryotic-like serine/threonine-protein kinase